MKNLKVNEFICPIQKNILTNMCQIEWTNDDMVIQIRVRKHYVRYGVDLPDGAIELGESALEALVREFYEETGVEVRVEKLLNVYTKYSDSYPNGDEAQVLTILYLVSSETSISTNFFTSDETLELGFFDHSNIQNIAIVNQQHQDMINDFFENKFPIDR